MVSKRVNMVHKKGHCKPGWTAAAREKAGWCLDVLDADSVWVGLTFSNLRAVERGELRLDHLNFFCATVLRRACSDTGHHHPHTSGVSRPADRADAVSCPWTARVAEAGVIFMITGTAGRNDSSSATDRTTPPADRTNLLIPKKGLVTGVRICVVVIWPQTVCSYRQV